jgi:hypothetical protein
MVGLFGRNAMSDQRNALAQVKPRLAELIDDLVGQGAERLSVIYVLEKEVAALRDGEPWSNATPRRPMAEPSNDWPGAER